MFLTDELFNQWSLKPSFTLKAFTCTEKGQHKAILDTQTSHKCSVCVCVCVKLILQLLWVQSSSQHGVCVHAPALVYMYVLFLYVGVYTLK